MEDKRPRQPNLDDEAKRYIWKHRYDKSANEIAREIGYTVQSVLGYLHKMGVTIRNHNRQ